MKIKELCESERPREKMFSLGTAALSNGELLAVLLRTGYAGKNVLEMSQELLAEAGGNLISLSVLSLEQLQELSGMGKGKAATLAACFELGRRLFSERSVVDKSPVVSPRMVYDMLIPFMLGLDHEECWVIFLNTVHYCIGMQKVSFGGRNETTIDLKEILRLTLEKKASNIILAHNHPSESPRPSKDDMRQTEALKKALTPMGIGLIDHVIICNDSYFSFSDNDVSIVRR